MVRERIGRNVIGLNKRSVEKISQRDAIARLKANIVFESADKRLLRDRNRLVEVARSAFRPIEHYTCRGNFHQAAYLQFFSRFLFFQNVARLCVGDEIRLCASSGPQKRHAGEKSGKNGKKTTCQMHKNPRTAAP